MMSRLVWSHHWITSLARQCNGLCDTDSIPQTPTACESACQDILVPLLVLLTHAEVALGSVNRLLYDWPSVAYRRKRRFTRNKDIKMGFINFSMGFLTWEAIIRGIKKNFKFWLTCLGTYWSGHQIRHRGHLEGCCQQNSLEAWWESTRLIFLEWWRSGWTSWRGTKR